MIDLAKIAARKQATSCEPHGLSSSNAEAMLQVDQQAAVTKVRELGRSDGRSDAGVERRSFLAACAAVALWPYGAHAASGAGKARVSFLTAAGRGRLSLSLFARFKAALALKGWVEGQNIQYDFSFADNVASRLPQIAKDVVDLKPDVIVAAGTLALLALKNATVTIPIVMTSSGDPHGSGFVADLAHPTGNITGLSAMSPEIGAKRVQILQDLMPDLKTVSVLWDGDNSYSSQILQKTQTAGDRSGIEVRSYPLRSAATLQTALNEIAATGSQAFMAVEDPVIDSFFLTIAAFANGRRMPSISGYRAFAEDGGLMSYGADYGRLYERAASFVDKILRGARPADLPIEQPTKLEMVLNLRTARMLGLSIPTPLLAMADEVIEGAT